MHNQWLLPNCFNNLFSTQNVFLILILIACVVPKKLKKNLIDDFFFEKQPTLVDTLFGFQC
jgi:hypothetical protein